MLHHTGHDVRRTAAACGEAPARVRRTCYASLGRDISAIAGPRLPEAVRLCGFSGPEFEPACHEGVVASLINMNAEASEGLPYCLAVESAAGKSACYETVGRFAFVGEGETRRAQLCSAVEADYVEACLGSRAPTAGAAGAGGTPGARR